MGKIKWVVGLVILAIIGFYGYSYFTYEVAKREALKSCEFRLADVRLKSIGLTSAELIIVLEIYNPNSIIVTLDRADFYLYGNDNYLGYGEITRRIDIPPYSFKSVNIPFTLEYSGAGGVIWSAIQRGSKIEWKITGTAYIDTPFGTMTVSFTEYY